VSQLTEGACSCDRRERPEILFDAAGAPTYLYNGVNTHGAALPNLLPDLNLRGHSWEDASRVDGSGGGGEGGGQRKHRGFGHAFSLVQAIRQK